jgi:hypothetical protein
VLTSVAGARLLSEERRNPEEILAGEGTAFPGLEEAPPPEALDALNEHMADYEERWLDMTTPRSVERRRARPWMYATVGKRSLGWVAAFDDSDEHSVSHGWCTDVGSAPGRAPTRRERERPDDM